MRGEQGGDFVTAGRSPDNREARLGGIGAMVRQEIEKRSGKESRVCVLGHLQRGGSPTTFDRALCSVFGAHAVELIAAEDFGKMVAFQGASVVGIPISEAVGKLKTVAPTAAWLAPPVHWEFVWAIERSHEPYLRSDSEAPNLCEG